MLQEVTVCFKLQTKYKEAGKKEANSCLYSLLPHTMETQRAKEAAELLSEVRAPPLGVPRFVRFPLFPHGVVVPPQIKYKESGKKEMSRSLYSSLPDTSESSFAREVTDMQSEVNASSDQNLNPDHLLSHVL